MKKTTFKVHPKLAALLGENYRSSEFALRELVDNAWDAEAKNVWIVLPSILTEDATIEFRDDGTGMTPEEVRNEYLIIANNRRDRKGNTTQNGRMVKGRKGIGKFAGLFVGSLMLVETRARGKRTTVHIEKKVLAAAKHDIEDVDLPVIEEECNQEEHGTTIRIRDINQNLVFPNPDRLRLVLIMEYGRQDQFTIYVNGDKLDVSDVKGKVFTFTDVLEGLGSVTLRFVISETNQSLRQPGLAVRVGGKTVGKPSFFGLEDNGGEIPAKLLKRVYGEVEADELLDYVTADWGALIENSKPVQILEEYVRPKLEAALRGVFKNEISLAKARLQKQVDQELRRLPAYKRDYARKALDRVLTTFYALPEQKLQTLIRVLLDTIEKDEYWEIIKRLDEAQYADVATFAEALNEFGLVELAMISRQASFRLQFLTKLQELVNNPETQEKDLHLAFEKNLWLLGAEYSLMTSNRTLVSTVEKITGKREYNGENARNRPDLLLNQDRSRQYLLIEFKRPSHTITRADVAQAEDYRQALSAYLPGAAMHIMLIGGKSNVAAQYGLGEKVEILTFNDVISSAFTMLNWLLEELNHPVRHS
ncbi:hypothetical protein FY528_19390 [Hymenobacter lutimineralis]|uniref:ATP-binding protein n=1 Tax=Hymenobacter lutimineralis TaxID=2606448 RepID=A0A5D6URL5_9BACT|nr:ATP-binding protein [Hymenobacter lutimineralis]TYZ06093.1 hypothetical protein FY528_19390 [Hymenobacter lutimineralis]